MENEIQSGYITKQAVEVIFSQKRNIPKHPPINFNGIPVKRECETQHLAVIIDDKLNLNREKLNLMYKIYVRPHLDYGDVIYHDQLTEMMKKLKVSNIMLLSLYLIAGKVLVWIKFTQSLAGRVLMTEEIFVALVSITRLKII